MYFLGWDVQGVRRSRCDSDSEEVGKSRLCRLSFTLSGGEGSLAVTSTFPYTCYMGWLAGKCQRCGRRLHVVGTQMIELPLLFWRRGTDMYTNVFRYKGLTCLARVSYLCLTRYAMKVCSLLQ